MSVRRGVLAESADRVSRELDLRWEFVPRRCRLFRRGPGIVAPYQLTAESRRRLAAHARECWERTYGRHP